ncbi:MAG: UvrD-helicase domain-containing protein, partial [Actinomycetota bacterium]|nr:UvrD-helicase domain-containing protein [Actinomycetota bacterium]
VRGPAACQRLRERYEVALVDEFQDTDPIQWDIMRRAFAETGATLVLIGDPKQAIYAFRGADVYAYLDAAGTAGTKATLRTNWRSDQGLVDAYDALFAGTRLGHEGIVYRAVRAAEANQEPRLLGAPHPEPLRIRVVHRDDGLVRLTRKGYVSAKLGLAHVAADMAGDLAELLAAEAEVSRRHDDGTEVRREPVRPGQVAVLVRTHRNAAVVRDALDAVGIPAVINGAGSVLATTIAREWLALVEALERPASPTRARAAALSAFLGWPAEQVAAADERAWEDVHARLHRWAGVLRRRGVASLLETITLSEGLPGRLLAREHGERRLTDLRHVGQLLHAEAMSERLGVTALATWLRQRIAEAHEDTRREERSRRLESDAEAVQVLTIHRSKGLEFPIVYYPDLWEPGWIPEDSPPVFHDDDGQRTINVGLGGPGFRDHWGRYVAEQRGEDLRLAYVALTRARHQAIVWWASSWDSRNSSLGRLLFSRDDDGNVTPEGDQPPDDLEVLARLGEVAAQAPGCISIERTAEPQDRTWTEVTTAGPDLQAHRFDRDLDSHWRRTSYTGVTSGAHEPRVASEPEAGSVTDEAIPPALVAPEAPEEAEAALRAVPSLLAAMPAGAAFGSLVHGVLEHVDFASADLDRDLRALVSNQLAWRQLDVGDPVTLVDGLRAAIATPLGPLLGDARLADFSTTNRLSELDFELPLVGGDMPAAQLTIDAIAAVLREHLPAGDALAGYPQRLADPALRRCLRGYLAGGIDLVLRIRDGDGAQRFAVVDHKTNWLGVDGEELSAWHYRPAALAAAMQRAHYPLQALLYTVALHRYLRWRLPGYDPARNLAGVLYLFVRGMTGPQTPRVDGQPCGVFAWRPPAGLVEALSDLFDRGVAA